VISRRLKIKAKQTKPQIPAQPERVATPDSSHAPVEWAGRLKQAIQSGQVRVGTIGLGYVGLPLAVEFAKAGLRVRLNAVPFANFIPKILNFDSSAYMLGWGVATFDALYSLQSLVRTKTAGADGSFNLCRISDPKLDKTIDEIKVTTDPKARDALLRAGLMATRDQAYYVPLHHQLRPWAMKKNVSTVHKADDRPESRFARVD